MSYRYKVIVQKEPGGGFSVYVPALAGCASQGETLDEAMANIKEAVDLYLEGLKADNLPIPADEIQMREVEALI